MTLHCKYSTALNFLNPRPPPKKMQHLAFALALAQSTQSSVQQQGVKAVKATFFVEKVLYVVTLHRKHSRALIFQNLFFICQAKLKECSAANLQPLPTHVLSNLILFLQTSPHFDKQDRQTVLQSAQALLFFNTFFFNLLSPHFDKQDRQRVLQSAHVLHPPHA